MISVRKSKKEEEKNDMLIELYNVISLGEQSAFNGMKYVICYMSDIR